MSSTGKTRKNFADNQTYSRNGIFRISENVELPGTITLNGEESVLHIWTNDPLSVESLDSETISGVLDNQQEVSLIDCIDIGEKRLFGKKGMSRHYKLFPHYAVIGQRHYSHLDKTISRVSFIIDDATALFHDRSAFGSILISPDQMPEVQSIDVFSKIPFEGNHPIVAYWTGKEEIFSANTLIGRISAFHRPTFDMGGPEGTAITNEIVVDVEFEELLSISCMDAEIRKLLRFFQCVVGRPQNLMRLEIVEKDSNNDERSTVHLNMYPNHRRTSGSRDPDFRDILIDAGDDPSSFSHVLCLWLERNDARRIARSRYFSGWTRGNTYDADRMVGAANMFDLLPTEAIPSDAAVENCLEEAIEKSRAIFLNLAKSQKCQQILSYLGRFKRPTLKEKIRYRSALITSEIGDAIPDIDTVTDAAVDLRNVFVHGSSFSRERTVKLQESICFLTDTLEFVFCASDFIDAGWDIETCHMKPKGMGHPFAQYVREYSKNLVDFRE